jgi:hypothetical protein
MCPRAYRPLNLHDVLFSHQRTPTRLATTTQQIVPRFLHPAASPARLNMNVPAVMVVVVVAMTLKVRPVPSSTLSVTSSNNVDSPSPISTVVLHRPSFWRGHSATSHSPVRHALSATLHPNVLRSRRSRLHFAHSGNILHSYACFAGTHAEALPRPASPTPSGRRLPGVCSSSSIRDFHDWRRFDRRS